MSAGLEGAETTERAMQIEQVTRTDQIRPGDVLLISDGKTITPTTAKKVKVSEYDGTEVIFDEKRNKFFNVGMYLEGVSWAKDVRIVRIPSNVERNRDARHHRAAPVDGLVGPLVEK